MTGVVGPNGCGKSNLVEALRWVMGETSAKRMRGGEMDDVIFAGSGGRPARNVAEVLVLLDNAARTAPAPFNDADTLEVIRRIERESGSTYRVNGREARARDVQLLFADAGTGAQSTGLVSQGRVGALINAKPSERRGLLEEAAGVAGLHSRRHEAELRLRGAETNLERLEDVLQALSTQLESLRKQAKQAERFRTVQGKIRETEALVLHLRWRDATDALSASRARLDEAERTVGELTRLAAAAARLEAEAAEALPDLRRQEAAAGAELQRLTLAREGLDAEERQAEQGIAECRARLEQIDRDLKREQGMADEASTACRRLAGERDDLTRAQGTEAEDRTAAVAAAGSADDRLQEAESAATRKTQDIASAEARARALERDLDEQRKRRDRLVARLSDIAQQRKSLHTELSQMAAADAATDALAEAEAAVEAARHEAEQAEDRKTKADSVRSETQEALRGARSLRDKLLAEKTGLEQVLAGESKGRGTGVPILDSVRVAPGYEAAFGAALGEDLSAPSGEASPDAARKWDLLPPFTVDAALPAGVECLADKVTAPDPLRRRLLAIGVVESADSAMALRALLTRGQRLVSREGGLWRWDGFTVAAGAPSSAATRLRQRNRLEQLSVDLTGADAAVTAAAEADRKAQEDAAAAADADRAARDAVRQAFQVANAARALQAKLAEQANTVRSKLSGLDQAAQSAQDDLAEAETRLAELEAARADLPDLAAQRTQAQALQAEVATARQALLEARGRLDRLKRDAESRTRRLLAIVDEERAWTQRVAESGRQIGELQGRRARVTTDLDQHSKVPDDVRERRARLLDFIVAAEERRKAAADRLASAEGRLSETAKALKEAETNLALGREERVRREGAMAQAEQALAAIVDRVHERLDCAPEEIARTADFDIREEDGASVDPTNIEMLDRRLDRLTRERDGMGPVNLRAEVEAAELQEQLRALETEREDLLAAIAKLRQGISSINKEARERLTAAFDRVNAHFKELFVRVFGGGQATLTLTDPEDPLETGLDILASPPGKKLQLMSLLSGGEQALTALSLLFAVFLTNPAPICVLDEVDAPLDDANVDRFCRLLEDLAGTAATRFLVVTHHRMTMARMDRLFGVTMPERGVSQLVSVDLKQAALMAAE